MKKLLFLLIILSPVTFSQSYNEDKKEIYTANNEVENTLGEANNILCTISKLKVEQFIDKGPYRAQVYDSRCDVSAARQDAQNQAQQGNQQQQQGAAEIEIPSTFVLDVKSAFSEVRNKDYLEVRGWFFQQGDYSEAQTDYEGMWDADPDMLIYFLAKVLAGASEEDPNGDIELDFVAESNCQNAPYQSQDEARQAALDAGVHFVNCIPTLISTKETMEIEQKFINKGLTIVGSDMRSAWGASRMSEVLQGAMIDSGLMVTQHIQMNMAAGSTQGQENIRTGRTANTDFTVTITGKSASSGTGTSLKCMTYVIVHSRTIPGGCTFAEV